MQVLEGNNDFCRPKLDYFLCPLLKLLAVVQNSDVAIEVATLHVLHDKKELIIGLEGVLHVHDERRLSFGEDVALCHNVFDLIIFRDVVL